MFNYKEIKDAYFAHADEENKIKVEWLIIIIDLTFIRKHKLRI